MNRPPSVRAGLPWGAAAFLLLVLSGLLNLVSSSWSPFFKLNLFLHPLLGIIVAAGAIRISAAQLRSRIPGLSPAMLVGFLALVFLGFFKAFVFRHYAIGASNAFSAVALLPIVVLGMFLYARGRRIPVADFRSAGVLSHAGRMILWSLAAASGVSILLPGGGRPAAVLADFHTATAVVAAATGVIAFLAASRSRVSRSVRAVGLAAVVASVVPFAVNRIAHLVQPRPVMSPTTIHLSAIPLERRLPEERDILPSGLSQKSVDETGPLPSPLPWPEMATGEGPLASKTCGSAPSPVSISANGGGQEGAAICSQFLIQDTSSLSDLAGRSGPTGNGPAEQTPAAGPIGAEWIDISASCGSTGGCHSELLDDLRHSVHAVSYVTPHLQKNLVLLAGEIGPQNQAVCAGCHTPAALFPGGGRAEDYRQRTNVSCVFCHVISDVSLADDPRKSSYTLDLPVEHLAMFVGAERNGGRLSTLNRLLIRLNPSAHGRVFQRALYSQDRYCMACHHLQLRGVAPGRTCIQCHMEPRDVLGLPGRVKNHLFPGANTTIPALVGFDDYAALTERWMQGLSLRRSIEDPYDLEQFPRVMPEPERLAEFYYLAMSAQFDPAPRRGSATRLRIQTSNTGIGHAFPSSSLDLEEVWLEVRVTDESGRLLFSSGGLNDAQEVLPGSHKLGGHMIGLDGNLVTHYRIWQIRDEIVERMILPGETIADDFSVAIPADCGDFITVEAQWRYRKLNHDYWAWAYGTGKVIPSPVVARQLQQFRLARDAGEVTQVSARNHP